MNDEVKLYSSGTLVSAATILTGGTLATGGNNYMYVSNGGTANNTVIQSGGSQQITKGGLVNNTTVNPGGCLYVKSGTVLSVKENGGYINISSGKVTFISNCFSNVVLDSSVKATVYSGTTANSTIINSWGQLYISGGIANCTVINSDGFLDIYSGGTANNTNINGEGYLNISAGGIADYTSINSGGLLQIHSNGIANSTTINAGGDLKVYDDGIANHTIINSGGYMCVGINNAMANSTIVNPGGKLHVDNGGMALAIKENGGYVDVESNADVTFLANKFDGLILIDNQSATLHSGTTADSTTIDSYGELYIFSSGAANNTTINTYGDMVVSSGGTANRTTVNLLGGLHISSGGIVNDTAVNQGFLNICDGGTANSTTVNEGGQLELSSGGIANNTVINSGGHLSIDYCGGTAYCTTVNDGGALGIGDGGKALAVKENGGYVDFYNEADVTFVSNCFEGMTLTSWTTLHSGTTANNATIRGILYIFSGGIANNTAISGGSMFVSSGGIANNTIDNGSLTICSGGTAYRITVKGRVDIESGGTANIAELSDGVMYVYGGTANSTTINSGGELKLSSRGIANDTAINAGGSLHIYRGITANSTMVNVGGRLYVENSGTALAIKENGGYVFLRNGANATFVSNCFSGLVLSQDSATLHSGTTANNTTLHSGGEMKIYSAGIHSGTLFIESGAFVSAYQEAIIDFTVATQTEPNMALINNWSLISGGDNASYTITVETNQTSGTYILADGATDFSQSISVKNTDGIILGTISVGGTLKSGSAVYMLNKNDSVLSLNIVQNHDEVKLYRKGVLVSSAQIMDNKSLNGWNYDSMTVSSGGIANNTLVNYFDAGVYVYSGGIANSTTLSGGDLHVYTGGTANSTTVNTYCSLRISGGGTANYTAINSGGWLVITGNGTADCTTLSDRGSMYIGCNGIAAHTNIDGDCAILYISSGGTANSTTVNANGSMYVSYGGTALEIKENGGYVDVAAGANVSFAANSFSGSVLSLQKVTLHSGTTANDITMSGGNMTVFSGGTANSTNLASLADLFVFRGGVANDTTVNSGSYLYVGYWDSAGTADSTMIKSGGSMIIYSGGIAANTRIFSGGGVYISSAAVHSGWLQIENGATVSVYHKGAVIDFTVAKQTAPATALINNWSLLSGGANASYTLTVNADQAAGEYILAEGAAEFSNVITVKNTDNTELGTISVGGELVVENTTYSLALNDSMLKLTVFRGTSKPTGLAGDSSGISWNGSADSYVAEYSSDDFAHGLRIASSQTAIDTYGMDGSYDWRVRNGDSANWAQGEKITAVHEAPQELVSDEDGVGDVFFGIASEFWGSRYRAQHLGVDSWGGTKEYAALAGKNQITDVFSGSTDANILVLTDDGNGDALFLDDIYSAFPTEQKARLAQIDEIRAGAGDDVVDLTTQRFSYTNGVTLRGGDGDDTLWANRGENRLFGDSGNDRLVGCFNDDVLVGGIGNDSMNGGGGNDIFCFCKGWGNDTVEQLEGGLVTLWFVSGCDDNWDPETMTYTAGSNSVKITGVSTVTLKYGDDGSEQYDVLVAAGAFMEALSFNIFEEENKGVIAKL